MRELSPKVTEGEKKVFSERELSPKVTEGEKS